DFDFAPDAFLEPQRSLVVVKDIATFRTTYGPSATIAGEFQGDLDPRGEILALVRPSRSSNEIEQVVNRVKYESRPPWSVSSAPANRGSSLQLIDPLQDNTRVSNWADGTSWRFFSFTGKPNSTSSPKLYFYLDGAGDVYLDDLK